MKQLLTIIFALSLSTSALAFDFDSYSFNYGGGNRKCTDILPVPTFSPTSVAYGDKDTGTTTDSIVTLTNSGNGVLSAASLAVTGTSFSLQSTTCGSNPFNLAASADCTATVRFAPLTAASFTGSLTLSAPNLDNVVVGLSGTGTASEVAYLLNQNFEGAGYDNSETWTETLNGGTINEDYTTIALYGSQSLNMIAPAANAPLLVSPTFTATPTPSLFLAFRFNVLPTSADQLIKFRNGSTEVCRINYNSTNQVISVTSGADTQALLTGAVINTTYYLWIDQTASTGVAIAYLSTTTTKPETGVTANKGSASAETSNMFVKAWNSMDIVVDRILLSDSVIGSNP